MNLNMNKIVKISTCEILANVVLVAATAVFRWSKILQACVILLALFVSVIRSFAKSSDYSDFYS